MGRSLLPVIATLCCAVGAANSAKHSIQGRDGSSAAKAIIVNNSEDVFTYIKTHFGSDASLSEPLRDEKRAMNILRVNFADSDGKKHAIYFAYPFDTKDYLKKGESQHEDGLPEFDRYETELKRILSRAWDKDVVVRTVHLPPFDPEWIVGVVQSPAGYRAFRLEASHFIWAALIDAREKLPGIRGIYRDRSITNALAMKIATLWRNALSNPSNYREDTHLYGDNSHFLFFVNLAPSKRLAAQTSYFERGTDAWELIQVSDALYDYVGGKVALKKLESSVQVAEKKINATR
jgi:hypothetical protein